MEPFKRVCGHHQNEDVELTIADILKYMRSANACSMRILWDTIQSGLEEICRTVCKCDVFRFTFCLRTLIVQAVKI